MPQRLMFNGLVGRILTNAGMSREDKLHVFVAVTVAAANYPKGAPPEVEILPPQISQEQVWAATEAFVDHGVGTLDDLFQAIWGLNLREYIARIAAQHAS